MINLVQVVKAVPVRAKLKLSGVELLHRPAVGKRHAGHAKGDFPLPGVGLQRLQDGLHGPVPRGKQIHAMAEEMGEHHQVPLYEGGVLASPQKQVDKGVLASQTAGLVKPIKNLLPAGEVQTFK